MQGYLVLVWGRQVIPSSSISLGFSVDLVDTTRLGVSRLLFLSTSTLGEGGVKQKVARRREEAIERRFDSN